jgi:chemotaxis response regulator CheB
MTQKKIMLVDDSNMMRLIVRNMLASDPNFIITASVDNGKQALNELAHDQPDLIFLDLEMPEMDGIEFLRAGRAKTNAKIVVLSSIVSAGSPQAAQARSLGADAIISKPSGAVSFDLQDTRGSELFGTMYRLLGMGVPAVA